MLTLYRDALALRREHPDLGEGGLTRLPSAPVVLAFARDGDTGFACVVNLSDTPAGLPEGAQVLLASAPLTAAGRPAPDAAVWLTGV